MSKTSIYLWTSFIVFLFTFCSVSKDWASVPENNLKRNIGLLKAPKPENVLVAAHRGDWRNAPENSILALKNIIAFGVDVMELDLKRTKDGTLIIMHDNTIDRATNGKGNPEDFTLEEIKKLRLKNGLGRATDNCIPTFKEMLTEAKGKILIDVDKGFCYFLEVVNELRETGTLDQAIINIDSNTFYDSIVAKYGNVDDDIFIMPVINCNDSNAQAIIDSYKKHRNTIFQVVFDRDDYSLIANLQTLRNDGFGVWLNSLWASLNGGHDDDRAVEKNQPGETWGWLVDHGASIIQTDRPQELLNYLRENNLHK
jgi:glycerophosphoryl diester phosphodiesterase